jgi:DNA mismatch repair protein MutS
MTDKQMPVDLSFSLLWPSGKKTGTVKIRKQSAVDLDIQKLVDFMAFDAKHRESLGNTLNSLCLDADTINYRFDILDDLIRFPVLVDCLRALIPVLNNLRYYQMFLSLEWKTALQEAIWRLRELEHYVECIEKLSSAFEGIRSRLCSQGLTRLCALVQEVQSSSAFRNLRRTLPDLLSKIRNLKSITIGVNLDAGLMPYEATLISINEDKYKDSSLFTSLFGDDTWRGIASLHRAPEGSEHGSPLMVPLFKDISRIMDKITQPLVKALKEFVSINSRLFIQLQDDFLFYLGAAKLMDCMQRCGLPVTKPKVLEMERRQLDVRDLYNIDLVLHLLSQHEKEPAAVGGMIVKNDFSQGEDGRIIILTGPNRGGKTTFLQAMGLAQAMMQVGLFVPAREAAMSICDDIFTHYPALERLDSGTGRFGEEAGRISAMFDSATRHSLILLNESLSSTSWSESLYLAQDILRVLRMLGTRALYATHLHGLAASAEQVNRDTPGESRLLSMAAQIEHLSPANSEDEEPPIKPTFKIVPGPPDGKSYAVELASRFGISKKKLISRLRQRGELDASPSL